MVGVSSLKLFYPFVQVTSPSGANLKISVAESDIGQVIGKQGKIANSIRTIAKAAGTKRDLKVFIEILD